MALAPTSPVHRLRIAAYVILFTAMAFALADLLMAAQPMRPGTLTWRFGVMGLAANAVMMPLVMLLIAAGIAALYGDRKMLFGIGGLAAVLTLMLVAGAGAFVLDAVQMRRQVRPEALARFDLASVQAIVKMVVEAAGATLLAVGAIRGARALRAAPAARPRDASMLVVGSAGKPGRPAAADTVAV